MAARRQRQAEQVRGDEAELDPVEAADEAVDDESEEALEEVDPDLDDFDDDLDDDDAEVATDDVSEDVPLPDEADEGDTVLDAATVPSDAAFDDEEDAAVVAVVTGDDEDDDEVDGLRSGEFVCRSCYMAKLESQLADAERMLCRDCA